MSFRGLLWKTGSFRMSIIQLWNQLGSSCSSNLSMVVFFLCFPTEANQRQHILHVHIRELKPTVLVQFPDSLQPVKHQPSNVVSTTEHKLISIRYKQKYTGTYFPVIADWSSSSEIIRGMISSETDATISSMTSNVSSFCFLGLLMSHWLPATFQNWMPGTIVTTKEELVRTTSPFRLFLSFNLV